MSRITERGATSPLGLFSTLADSSLATIVGAKFDASDGREFVIVQNGGTALVAGNLIQGPAKVANHQNMAVTTYTAASVSAGTPATVIATLGNTLTTANQYQGGYMVVNAGTGLGQTFKVQGNTAASASAACTFYLEDAPVVALSTSDSKVSVHPNPYGSANGTNPSTLGVVICPTTLTGQVIGVTLYAIAASTTTAGAAPTYGFIQTSGPVACLNDANTAIGLDLMPSTNTAGAVMTYVVATGSRVGSSTQAGVTTESRLITVQL